MPKIMFSGHSDDLLCCEAVSDDWGFKGEEANCYDKPGVLRVEVDGFNDLIVIGNYCEGPGPCWSVGCCQADQDEQLPLYAQTSEWGIATNGYSVTLTINVPKDVKVSVVE